MKIKFLILSSLVLAGFLGLYYFADASNTSDTRSNLFCGADDVCVWNSIVIIDYNNFQGWQVSVSGVSPNPVQSPWRVEAWSCLSSSGIMWAGSCWKLIDRSGFGSYSDGGAGDIGSDDRAGFGSAALQVRTNNINALHTISLDGRRVSIDSFNVPSSAVQGDNFTVSWSTDWTNTGSGRVDLTVPTGISCSGSGSSRSCTGTQSGTYTLTLEATGPGGIFNTPMTVEQPRSITINPSATLTCQDPNASNYGGPLPCVYGGPTCSPSVQGVQPGQTANLNASGGAGNFSWSAPGGSPSNGNLSTFSTTYSATGVKTVTVSSAGQSASCTVDVKSPPATCGNNVIDAGEECDTGVDNGSCPRTCSNVCTINICSTPTPIPSSTPAPVPGGCFDDGVLSFSSPPPSLLTPGQVVSFGLNALNTGNDRWWHPAVYVVEELTGASTTMIAPIAGGCSYPTVGYGPVCFNKYPGEAMDWTFNLTAPSTPGSYTLQMMMVHVPTVGAVDAMYLKPDGTTCHAPATFIKFGNTLTHNFTVAAPPAPTVDLKVKEKGQSDTSYTDGPLSVSWNTKVTLKWTPANSANCTASGDWSGSKSVSGGTGDQGPLREVRSYNYNISCSGNGSASDSTRVDVGAPSPSASNITITQPNFCVSGPAATVGWTYSDPGDSPQSAYQVQIDDQGSFQTPEWDSGKVFCENCRTNSTPQGYLAFNVTYRARVRVWNGFDAASSWTESSSWKTPNNAFPQVGFTFAPANPQRTQPIQFTDQTVFYDGGGGHNWSWLFGDGGSSTQQNPVKSYADTGTYNVTLTATDSQNQSCPITKPVNVQEANPIWKEINPGG